jgi:preprotein translocase subunit SecD
MTPEEKNETFEIFEEVKSNRTRQLIDAVLKDDYISAREIAKRMVQDDEILCEVTERMSQSPNFTRKEAVEWARARVQAQSTINVAPTAWERILEE